jgi:putative integral membrane protein (TIGR02587 family)
MSSVDRAFLTGLARAFGGALFFALPLLMTMEMWDLGFHIDRFRLALFLAVFVPILIGLTHYAGFEKTHGPGEDVRDTFVALLVGFLTAAMALTLFGVLDLSMSLDEWAGKITLAAIPASIGATLAASLLAGENKDRETQPVGTYAGELFLMIAGAIFFAFNVAPTEEMVLITYMATEWHVVALAVVSLLVMHAFVYAVEFRGQEARPEGVSQWSVFARFTIVGYAMALIVSGYVLWTFGRYEGADLSYRVATAIVLGFPAALGAAAARLVL